MGKDFSQLPYRPCAGIMLINDAGLIFAGRRIDRAGGAQEAWQMPQGGIDEGETPAEAAIRELGEEIGIGPEKVAFLAEAPGWIDYDLPPELLGKIWKGRYRGQRQKWFLYRFTGEDGDVNIATEHPEFSAWQWIEADALVASIVPFKRQVYERVVAAFRPHLA